ncbi:TPA: transketolase, partial [Staphylococcus aureus]|nr:transketolase [Staphylococcus aureus]
IYVDKDSLKTYINELSSLLKGHKIITVEEHRQTGSISNLLASLIDNTVIPFTPNDEYPHHGGSHAEVLNQLGFSKEKLLTLLKEVE